IEYSLFRDYIHEGVIRRVELGPEYYTGFSMTRVEVQSLDAQDAAASVDVFRTARCATRFG
ncbi:MAG: hypothetical protein ACOC0Y_02310, partial [Spirochaetota bacterium]